MSENLNKMLDFPQGIPDPDAPTALPHHRGEVSGLRQTPVELQRHFWVGNAPRDAIRGWFVGQFIPEEGLRRQTGLEIKWGAHEAGDRRANGWSMCETSTTISVLLRGQFVVSLRVDGQVHRVQLDEPGDYVVYGPGVPHTWEAPDECIVLSVRAPSVPDDEITIPE